MAGLVSDSSFDEFLNDAGFVPHVPRFSVLFRKFRSSNATRISGYHRVKYLILLGFITIK